MELQSTKISILLIFYLKIMESQDNKTQSISKNPSSLKKIKSSLTIEQNKKGPIHYNYFYNHKDQVISFKIPLQIYNVKDAIQQSIQILNQNHNLNLSSDYLKYELYAAKKTGKKKSDLPSFDYAQVLQKTKIENFCIQLKKNTIEVIPEQVEPVSAQNIIVSNGERKIIKQQGAQYGYYDSAIKKQNNKVKQIPPQPTSGCFCFNKKK